MSSERIRLVVLFGGQSAEHDVSCVSAFHVLEAADKDKYQLDAVGITREGRWVRDADAVRALSGGMAALPNGARQMQAVGTEVEPLHSLAARRQDDLPVVVLPILHGPQGEDGTVQGLLELANVPYVGSGVLGSALCMDKLKAKDVLAAHGFPQVAWFGLRARDIDHAERRRVEHGLEYPVFVKPANLGSSVGVSRALDAGELAAACAIAASYDEWIIVEQGVTAREIEVAVLGNEDPRASVPGEILPTHDFYDYEDKYLDGAAEARIPADLPDEVTDAIRAMAVDAFVTLRCEGLARVDFFYEEDPGRILVNEVNTIPGFTPISMYPQMWEASGLSYSELIDELVRLALERHQRRQAFSTQR